jgi:lycopene cyclase domain-containing protein
MPTKSSKLQRRDKLLFASTYRSILNLHYTYFLILAASLAGPLALSFDKKVGFYKQWKYLFPAMVLPAALYIAWDIWFTAMGVWSFNENYIIGNKYGGLPIEEILFFFVVPYCCVFIYECIRVYFPTLQGKQPLDIWFSILADILLLVATIFWDKAYTSATAGFLFVGLVLFEIFKKQFPYFNSRLFLISYAVILIPFLIVNGFLTAIPVVLYNDAENLGARIYTIPVEDVFYGMLLVFLNILLFEFFRHRK